MNCQSIWRAPDFLFKRVGLLEPMSSRVKIFVHGMDKRRTILVVKLLSGLKTGKIMNLALFPFELPSPINGEKVIVKSGQSLHR